MDSETLKEMRGSTRKNMGQVYNNIFMYNSIDRLWMDDEWINDNDKERIQQKDRQQTDRDAEQQQHKTSVETIAK